MVLMLQGFKMMQVQICGQMPVAYISPAVEGSPVGVEWSAGSGGPGTALGQQ